MVSITFYQLGNADSYRIDLSGGQKLLFDYANVRCADGTDKYADLPSELRKDLKSAGRDDYDVVAFTHFDNDHVCGASEFFELHHAEKYQGNGRIKMPLMWVPAWAITESRNDLCTDGKILQAEARYRFENGEGIRVFSRPEKLRAWLESKNLTLASRQDLITDAGQLVPGWSKESDGVEFFVHSPFASRQNDGTLNDRNSNSLVFQAVLVVGDSETKVLLMADTEWECMEEIVRITKAHIRGQRLEWDLLKLPHHCSAGSLGPEKGKEKTAPVSDVAWLYESQGRWKSRIICTSDPIPSADTDQPPHFQAANYYRDVVEDTHQGEFLVTMEQPTLENPAPLVIRIGGMGPSVARASAAIGASITGRPAPRAG